MKVRNVTRGEPLVALCLVLVAWIALRVLMWNVVWFAPSASAESAGARLGAIAGLADAFAPRDEDDPARQPAPEEDAPAYDPPAPPARLPRMAYAANAGAMARIPAAGGRRTPLPELGESGRPFYVDDLARPQFGPAGSTYAHDLVQGLRGAPKRPSPVSRAAEAAAGDQAGRRRWSGDAWVLLRSGAMGPLSAGVAPSTYGAGQSGGVLRYAIAPESRFRPKAYLRTTASLDGAERDLALGIAARLVHRLPIAMQAELRASQQPGGTRLRPAIMAVSELAPFALPQGLRGEAYVQAGYVGGRYATPFVDGQLRADRRVAALKRAELRAGAGIWGGMQRGAARLDLGPAATLGVPLGRSASARVAVDWRLRVAGKAAPASGPALTLSAGF